MEDFEKQLYELARDGHMGNPAGIIKLLRGKSREYYVYTFKYIVQEATWMDELLPRLMTDGDETFNPFAYTLIDGDFETARRLIMHLEDVEHASFDIDMIRDCILRYRASPRYSRRDEAWMLISIGRNVPIDNPLDIFLNGEELRNELRIRYEGEQKKDKTFAFKNEGGKYKDAVIPNVQAKDMGHAMYLIHEYLYANGYPDTYDQLYRYCNLGLELGADERINDRLLTDLIKNHEHYPNHWYGFHIYTGGNYIVEC